MGWSRPVVPRTSRRRWRTEPNAKPTSPWAGRRRGEDGGPRPSTAQPTPPGRGSGWRRSTWPSRSWGNYSPHYLRTRNSPRSRSSDWLYATSPISIMCWMSKSDPLHPPTPPSTRTHMWEKLVELLGDWTRSTCWELTGYGKVSGQGGMMQEIFFSFQHHKALLWIKGRSIFK